MSYTISLRDLDANVQSTRDGPDPNLRLTFRGVILGLLRCPGFESLRNLCSGSGLGVIRAWPKEPGPKKAWVKGA